MTPSDDLPAELPVESLRRLARGLVFERGSADDLVQDAWLAALETRGEIRGLGGWLAGAVRKLARNRAREEARRVRRERGAARPEAQPSALEAGARIEVLRKLIEAVDRLDAPYREAIVLRYFDDLPPRAIAARLGVPVNTARTHVRRGIERLRADLDPGSERERETLLSALVPLLGPPLTGRVIPDPAKPWRHLMQHPFVLATSVLVLGTLAWFLGHPNAPGPALGRGNLATSVLERTADPLQEPGTTRAQDSSPKSSAAQVPAPSGRAPLGSGWTVRGRVFRGNLEALPNASLVGRVHAGGRPVGSALLEQHFQADSSGNFAWSLTPPAGLYSVQVEGAMPGHRGRPASAWFLAGDPAPEDWSLFLYPLDVTIRGTVRGPDGAPLAGAFVGTRLGDDARAVRSGSDGAYELALASGLAPRGVVAWSPGLAPGHVAFAKPAPGAQLTGELVLSPELRLHGFVRDGSGNPIPNAEVVQSSATLPGHPDSTPASPPVGVVVYRNMWEFEGAWPRVTTDANGRYEIGGLHPQAVSVLLSVSAPGLRPGEVSCSQPATMGARDWNVSLASTATLTGRVRAASEPVEAAWICIGDWAGEIEGVEAWSDAEGRFTLTNVPTGRQHLWIWRRGHAQLRHDVNVVAGLGALELELAPGHSVGGLVLGPDGAPMPNASVWAEDPSDAGPPRFSGYGTNTNAHGRFRLADLPEARIALTVSARGCEYLTQEVALDRDDLVLRLVAAAEPVPAPLPPVPVPVVPVTAASGGASLAGRLLDLAGNGRAGAEIELAAVETTLPAGPWRATTGTSGEFTLAGLPAGTFDARWLRREAGLVSVDLETRFTLASDEARSLELLPAGQTTLHGTIEFQDPPEGSVTVGYGTPPVLGDLPPVIAVQLVRLTPHGPLPGTRRGTFAHDGRFELEGLQAGKWSVKAQIVFASGFKTHCGSELEVPAQGTTELVLGILRPQ